MTPGIVVAGGGLAGAAAASALAQAGRVVTLIERETGPVDKICGEFLSTEGQDYLSRLGLNTRALGGAPISRLRLVRGAESVSTDLPFQAIGLSRFKLDEALLLHARQSGVRVLRGHSVRSIGTGDELTLDVEGVGSIAPQTVMLATGKHEVRGAKREFSVRRNLIGFKMYFRLSPASRATLDEHIELIFFAGGYAGLQMIEDGIANLCLLVNRDRYRMCGGSWEKLLAYLQTASSFLANQLAGAEAILPQPLTIYQVPYGFIHRPRPDDCDQLFRLGDQACVIHSFTGDGMSIALHSAARAVQSILQGQDSKAYHHRLARDVRGQIRRADALYALMNHAAVQSAIFQFAKRWPTSLRIAAQLTRIPSKVRI
jgi:flavin-dependent dehydrogenase